MRKRVRKYADGGAVLAEPPIPDAPQVTAAPIPDPVIEPDELEQSGLPDSAKAWLRKPENERYLYDENASAKLAALHYRIVDDEGIEPYSPAYFKRIEQRLEQPPASTDVDQEAVDRVLEQARRSAPKPKVEDDVPRVRYQAPPSRQVPNSNGTRAYLDDPRSVILTREQREAAKFSGVSLEEYARQFLELQRRKALGDFTGQP